MCIRVCLYIDTLNDSELQVLDEGMLQFVAVCCSVLQCVQCVAVCCSVLQYAVLF